jgi:dipeptidyl aminopeptidase/acylaminoacyl peptidase
VSSSYQEPDPALPSQDEPLNTQVGRPWSCRSTPRVTGVVCDMCGHNRLPSRALRGAHALCRHLNRRIAIAAVATFFTLICHAQSTLTPAQVLNFRSISDVHLSPDGSRLAYVVYSYQWDWLPRLWVMDVATANARQLTPEKKSDRFPEWSPDGKSLAFLSNRDGKNQVYTVRADGGEVSVITSRKYGVRNFHWSPDGRAIAYLAKDDSAPVSDIGPQVADRESDLLRLWVTELASGMTHRLGRTGYRIDQFQWQNPTHILVSATDQPRVEERTNAVYSVSVRDGALTLVSRPPQPFGGLLTSPNGKQFAVRSTRANGPAPRDLFLGTITGDDLHDISVPPDRTVAEVHWHEQSTIWMRVIDGFRNRIWRFSPDGTFAPIELPLSVDSFDVSNDGVLVYAGGDFDHLTELYIRAKSGGIRQLTHLQEGLDEIHLAPTTIFWTKSFDGTPLESALVRPSTAHPGDKFPLVLLVHGGPGGYFSSGYDWDTSWAQLLAAHGYGVLMVNPRGSNGYSEEFMMANRGDWGGGDYKDLVAVLDGVLAAGEADPYRLGIGGWSYGGEMSEWAITQTGRFKAAVAGAGVFDQQAEFETEDSPATDEWHFGTPWDHPDVFARNSPSTYIRNAHTPTLILDGEEDTSNPAGQSKGLYRALKHFGVETEMVLYPGEGHSPLNGSYNVDMFERILNWYDRFLLKTD